MAVMVYRLPRWDLCVESGSVDGLVGDHPSSLEINARARVLEASGWIWMVEGVGLRGDEVVGAPRRCLIGFLPLSVCTAVFGRVCWMLALVALWDGRLP